MTKPVLSRAGPDGFRLDVDGNLCFGGLKRNRLFITAGQSVYSRYVEAQGVPYS
jgi:sugar lactone lactonase YvrE